MDDIEIDNIRAVVISIHVFTVDLRDERHVSVRIECDEHGQDIKGGVTFINTQRPHRVIHRSHRSVKATRKRDRWI